MQIIFRLFVLVLQNTFLISLTTHSHRTGGDDEKPSAPQLVRERKKKKRWLLILRWTTRSIPRTKTAQCQWQRYLFVCSSVSIVEHHRNHKLFVGGTRVVACVFLS